MIPVVTVDIERPSWFTRLILTSSVNEAGQIKAVDVSIRPVDLERMPMVVYQAIESRVRDAREHWLDYHDQFCDCEVRDGSE